MFDIASVIGHYITVYKTYRRILTDQGCNFELEQYSKFSNLLCILKIRPSAYYPQFNMICERWYQTIKR